MLNRTQNSEFIKFIIMKLLKNSFLGTVFLLAISSTSFALTSNENQVEAVKRTCVPTTLSCGINGYSCGDTTQEIIENAIAIDEMVCP